MTPKQRFRAWVVAAGGTFAAGVVNALVDGWAGFGVTVVQLAGLTSILWLLVTTPVDAIKLKRWVSVVVILGGFAVIFTLRFISLDITPPDMLGHLLLASAVFVGLLTLAPIGPVLAISAARLRHRWGTVIGKPSPWWAVVMAWHPFWAFRLTDAGVDVGEFPIGQVLIIGMTMLPIAAAGLGRLCPDRPIWMWLVWTVAVGCMIVYAWLAAAYPL